MKGKMLRVVMLDTAVARRRGEDPSTTGHGCSRWWVDFYGTRTMLELDTVAPDVHLCDSDRADFLRARIYPADCNSNRFGTAFQKRRSSQESGANLSNKDSSQLNDTVSLTLCYVLILAKEDQVAPRAPAGGVLHD